MGSVGNTTGGASSNNYEQYAPAWDYSGEDYDDRNDINTGYFEGITNMPVDTNLNDWVDDARAYDHRDANVLGNYVLDSTVNSNIRDNPNFENDETRNLDRIIANHTLDKATTLYSGLSNLSAGNLNVDNLKAGDTFSINSYVSTSPDPVYASGYALISDNQPTVLKISAPAGTNIAKTYHESAYGTEGILGRNNQFTVSKITSGSIDGQTVRIVEVRLNKRRG